MATRDLAFCLFATCFHFYDSISFAGFLDSHLLLARQIQSFTILW